MAKKLTLAFLAIILIGVIVAVIQLNRADDQQVDQQQGELQTVSYEEIIGRDDADIQSEQTYRFELPVGYRYELQGVDAQSSQLWVFNPEDVQVMTAVVYDHTNVNWVAADPNNTQVQGHTIMIVSAEDEEVLEVFKQTLQVGGERAYN